MILDLETSESSTHHYVFIRAAHTSGNLRLKSQGSITKHFWRSRKGLVLGAEAGVNCFADSVADLLHASTLAIVGVLILDRLAHTVPSSEAYLDLLEVTERL